MQIPGVDYTDAFSQVASDTAIRVLTGQESVGILNGKSYVTSYQKLLMKLKRALTKVYFLLISILLFMLFIASNILKNKMVMNFHTLICN
jgi:hypothetical protein